MPGELIAALVAAILGLSGATLKRFSDLERRIDSVELRIAQDYITKEDFILAVDRIYKAVDRFECKLDYHVFGERTYGKDKQAGF